MSVCKLLCVGCTCWNSGGVARFCSKGKESGIKYLVQDRTCSTAAVYRVSDIRHTVVLATLNGMTTRVAKDKALQCWPQL